MKTFRFPALLAAVALLFALLPPLRAAVVYETPGEFFGSGDFNGDGLADVLVVDRATGNARVAYQNAAGAVAWSAPLLTGVPQVGAVAVGRFFNVSTDAVAVTSAELNRVMLMSLADSNSAGAPFNYYPRQPRTSWLVALRSSTAPESSPEWVGAGSVQSDPGRTFVELFNHLGTSLTFQQDAELERPGAFFSGVGSNTWLSVMQRGPRDSFVVYNAASPPVVMARQDELPSGTEYVMGRFHGSVTPRLFFYQPGSAQIRVQRVLGSPGSPVLSAPTLTTLPQPIQRLYVLDEGTNGLLMAVTGLGVATGLRVVPGDDTVQVTRGFSADAAGHGITGFAPMGAGRFLLLSSYSNAVQTTHAQVFTRSGGDYVQTSASTLPAVTSGRTRANAWLFANEPFVTPQPQFISSLNSADWVNSISGLPGGITVVSETDRGTAAGLGNPTAQSLGAAPANALYGVPNQYLPSVSLFSYAPPRAPEPVLVSITPPAGRYENGVTISFQTRAVGDRVYYRVGTAPYQVYGAPFSLGSNAVVEYYGTNSGRRSELLSARYAFESDPTKAPLITTNSGGVSNLPPVFVQTNGAYLSPYGTVFYGRRSGSTGSIWAINLDGSGDRFITPGARPRVSRDGRFMAFLREGAPFNSQGHVWLRDLVSGTERRLFINVDYTVSVDWDRSNTTMLFDFACQLLQMGTNGGPVALPLQTDCYDDAPVVNPLTGQLAFHNLNPNLAVRGLYLVPPNYSTRQRLALGINGPIWPAWSPDGAWLSLVDSTSGTVDGGRNLWVVKSDGSIPSQITGFNDTNGFNHGAIWSPFNDALVGAGSIAGINGIWVVPLTSDRRSCASDPWRLPTLPGDAIDFVGSILVPPPPPVLFIRREGNEAVIFWRRSFLANVLESALGLGPNQNWQELPGPYIVAGDFFEVRVPLAQFPGGQFYRLRRF